MQRMQTIRNKIIFLDFRMTNRNFLANIRISRIYA